MLYFAWLKNSWIEGFRPVLTPSRWILSLGLFKNMFHNLLMYTNNFFLYIAVSCFFETFPGVAWGGWLNGWVVGKSNFNENPYFSLDLDFDLGFVSVFVTCLSTVRNWNFELSDHCSAHLVSYWPHCKTLASLLVCYFRTFIII